VSDYDLLPFPAERRVIVAGGHYGTRRSMIHGLLEVDVTQARALLHAAAEQGHPLSFTAYVVACLARAIAQNPQVQAYRDWRGRLVVFHDVDVVTMIEAEAGAVAVPHIIRAANRRTVRDISDEIHAVRTQPAHSQQQGGLVALAAHLPGFVLQLAYGILRRNPQRFKQTAGTVIISAVGMFGQGGGWGLTFVPMHTLALLVGGIAPKPMVHEGAITIRDLLSLTVSFDHDVVDGAPAARFAAVLREMMESAALLEHELALSSTSTPTD
jgi:pyruvate/2-oxoglutarate dehydrogenase complex dihydrolipoamide acyltransferase (E2) component